MSNSEKYLEIVVIAASVAGNEPLASALADRCGYTPADVQAIVDKIEPARAALRRMDETDGQLDRASTALKDNLADITANLSALRRTLKDNFDRADPIFKDLGLLADTPRPQEELLGFAETVFTNGQNLDAARTPLLTQRKWDAARFTAALEQVAAARAANVQQEIAKGQSLAATAACYDALDALDELFRPFAKNARSNLADLPGALEQMKLQDGIPVKPRRPQPASERKKPAPADTPAGG